jgi:hypothetical protein
MEAILVGLRLLAIAASRLPIFVVGSWRLERLQV